MERSMFVLSATIILLTFTVGAPILNLFVPYTVSGGSFFAKFHPASALATLLLLLVLVDVVRKGNTVVVPRHILIATLLMATIIFTLAVRGKGALAATFVDIHFSTAILLLAFSRLSTERVRALLRLFLIVAAINLPIVLIEFINQQHLLPSERFDWFFRPAGYFVHPITAGTLFYIAMFLIDREVLSFRQSRFFFAAFFFGVILCGVRGPLAIATLIFLSAIFSRAFAQKSTIIFSMVAILPILVGVATSLGLFDRIVELGLWDSSAKSRFLIFDTFHYLSKHELLSGVNSYVDFEWLARQTTEVDNIESVIVMITLHAGLPTAILFMLYLLILYGPAIRRSAVFGLVFVAVLLTTLSFATKSMGSMALAMLGYWVWTTTESHRFSAWRSRHSHQ